MMGLGFLPSDVFTVHLTVSAEAAVARQASDIPTLA